MIITLSDISKRYSSHWVLSNFNYQFESPNIYAIKGANGSGKSTLLKIISGFLSPTVGQLEYGQGDLKISKDDIYQYVTFYGPYVSLLQELSISEMINYYLKHKKIQDNLTREDIIKMWDVDVKTTQLVKELSSGQEQRLSLLLATLSTSSLLLFDEPTSFLDERSKDWFFKLLNHYKKDRLVILASNDENDFRISDTVIDIEN